MQAQENFGALRVRAASLKTADGFAPKEPTKPSPAKKPAAKKAKPWGSIPSIILDMLAKNKKLKGVLAKVSCVGRAGTDFRNPVYLSFGDLMPTIKKGRFSPKNVQPPKSPPKCLG